MSDHPSISNSMFVPFWDSASQIHKLRHVEKRMRGEKRYFISSPDQLLAVSGGSFVWELPQILPLIGGTGG
jgi:hypothetical protein